MCYYYLGIVGKNRHPKKQRVFGEIKYILNDISYIKK